MSSDLATKRFGSSSRSCKKEKGKWENGRNLVMSKLEGPCAMCTEGAFQCFDGIAKRTRKQRGIKKSVV